MKHSCLLAVSGMLYLGSSLTVTIAMDHPQYNLETFEKGMLKRALKSHLTYHEDDWREVCHASKGRLYGINEDVARSKFQEKTKNLENVYYDIFYDASNPDRENAKIVAGLQAKLMLRNYYNQQCQNIIVAYPKKYSAYSYTIPESHLIYILESLAYKLQEDMLTQLKWIQDNHTIAVDPPLIKAIEANPLTDDYHKTFELQLKEIQRIGVEEYLIKLEKAAEEQAKAFEIFNQEQIRLEQERMKNIPAPPPPPPSLKNNKVISYKERRAMLMNNLTQELKEQKNEVVLDEALIVQPVKKKLTLPPGAGKLPGDVLSEIEQFQSMRKLKPAGDRVLKKMVSDQASKEYLEFFNKLQMRRAVLKESDDENSSPST